MRLLMKFGGTSVADAVCIGRVVDIVEQHHKNGDEIAVVVSAQRGVTDQLIDTSTSLTKSRDASAIEPLIVSLRERHMSTLQGAAPGFVAEIGPIIEEMAAHMPDKSVKGRVKLYTDLPPCASCWNVMKQFMTEYPNVQMSVLYRRK